ncbi:phosphoribosylglycinamide formyltransferase [Ruminococcaceae bacterium OttesenSCG-928-O06]|nr:phosphoribosylglycinamide formyltransferase [Ruminococcaceae bacterium OttesenSCG-928-O06]
MKRVAVLVSGGGTNLQALIDAEAAGKLPSAKLVLVLASNPDAYALTRAGKAGIPTQVVARKAHASAEAFDEALLAALQKHQAEVVVLAGFLSILGPRVLGAYKGSIINVHPSLIPSFCGEGCYGLAVHRQALARGVKVTGATVHYVNEVVDGGEILLQKAVDVQHGDTPESLQRRVMETAEWEILPKALEMVCAQKLAQEGAGP